jgi:NAD(P)-dependent dehydrogenase (short-subunit alcohol dehydrogenase family)
MDLTDRVAIVTGGASGIGRGIALELARHGADIVVADVRETPKLDAEARRGSTVERVQELGRKAVFCECDVGDEDAVRTTVEATIDRFDRLDVLVNNAGIALSGGAEDLARADWDRVVEVNLTGAFLFAKYAGPHLRSSDAGRVVNLASTAGLEGNPESAAYCATKGGVVNLTRQLAVDFAPDAVTVNAICPGPIYTSQSQETFDDPDTERYEENVLLPYFGDPSDVGKLATFLASDGARYITGAAIPVDGGWMASS